MRKKEKKNKNKKPQTGIFMWLSLPWAVLTVHRESKS